MTGQAHRTLLRSGHVYAPASPGATAMVIEGDTVAWVGSDEAAASFADGVDETVDLRGAFVAPAFVDAHVHATATGLVLDGLDLTGCATRQEVLDAVAAYAGRRPHGVVLGHGWDETRWADARPPTTDELDRLAPGRPVYLSRVDVHSAVVSSALLARAPEAAHAEGFDPSGHVSRGAHHALRRAAYDLVTPEQRRTAQRATRRHAAALGIGCVHELSGPDIAGADDLAGLLRLATEEPGPD
ncbi:MAG: amidohydrolase family protein, partial [Actinomycetes bacterium]